MGKVKGGGKFKYVVIGAAVVVAAIGTVMFAMAASGSDDAEAKNSDDEDSLAVEEVKIDASSEYAKKVFECKVDDIADTAAMAKLLETMEIQDITGEYSVNIVADGDIQVVSFSLKSPVSKEDKKVFDQNMRKYAQQLLALVSEAGRVDWTYSLSSIDSQEESVTVSLDDETAGESLGSDIKSYGKSAKKFMNLLAAQSEM